MLLALLVQGLTTNKMALTEQEVQIVEYGQKAGKSKADVLAALDAYRSQEANPPKEKGFVSALKQAPSDLLGGLKKSGEDFYKAGEDVVDTALRPDRNLAEKATMIGGRMFGGSAQAIGDLLFGGAKALVSPETEEKVKVGVEKGLKRVLSSETGKDLMNKYASLSPAVKDQVDAAGGFASGLLELLGAKGAGKGLTTGRRLAGEAAGGITEGAKSSARAVVTPVRTLIERGKGSGIVQAGRELVERVPRAVERAGQHLEDAAARAERIKTATPAVKEAIKANLDDKIINSVSQADSATLKGYKEILDVAGDTKTTLGVKTRPEIVAGRAATDQYKVIDTQRKKVGQAIGDAVDELSKTTKVDMTPEYKAINGVLSKEGIKIAKTENGLKLDLQGSRFTPAERSKIQELYQLATESGSSLSPRQIHKMDNLFSKLQREAKFEGIGDIFVSTPDGDKSLFRVFRDIFSGKLDEVSPDIKVLNSQYRKLRGLQDNIEDSIVKTGSYDATKSTDLAEFAQTNLRRLGSDAQSAAAYREIAKEMDKVAREFGYKGANPEALIDFATEMRNLFPDAIPATSFTGILNKARSGPMGSRILGTMENAIMEGGAPGLKEQQKALVNLIDEYLGKSRSLKGEGVIPETTAKRKIGLSISNAFDDYKYNSDYNSLQKALEENSVEAKQIAEQSKKFLRDRNIEYLYRAGSPEGVSYSYRKSGAERFAQSGAANGGEPVKAVIMKLKITPEVLKRVQIVEGITGSGRRNNLGEFEVILSNPKK